MFAYLIFGVVAIVGLWRICFNYLNGRIGVNRHQKSYQFICVGKFLLLKFSSEKNGQFIIAGFAC